MRLKYYLRGVGIGIVVTTIIFMISISLHKNETKSQNTAVENDKSTTVSEAEKNAQKENVIGTETEETEEAEEAGTGKTDLADTQAADKTDAKQPDTNKSDSSKTDADNSDKKKPSDNTAKDNTSPGQKPSVKETQPKDDKTEKVRFEIKGGEFSDTVCQKLKSAGLIDDAAAFNTYLIQKDYDNSILPGIYDIPKDSTYEEIAVLLTTKVE